MSPEPTLQPLPYQHRTWFFRLLVTIFVCSVPVFIFYATGYRVSLTDTSNIISVGGIFVSAETENAVIYLNDEPVENYRLFQRAAYIQNLPAGVHRLHVQGEGLHTWVKELPVYPHIVTEAYAFTYPAIPQVRLITPYVSATGTPIVAVASGTDLLPQTVSYTTEFFASTTVATSTLVSNEEYTFVEELFATSSTSTVDTLRTRLQAELEESFLFSSESATTSATSSMALATTTRERNNRQLQETNDGLFVRWIGNPTDHPYYFCLNTTVPSNASTSVLGAYVDANLAQLASAQERASTRGDFTCRDEIAITTFDQAILLFDFMPDTNGDVVLVQVTDGLYAIEVDDRGWQNTQLLYGGTDFSVALFGEQIFIRDAGYYFELMLTLDT